MCVNMKLNTTKVSARNNTNPTTIKQQLICLFENKIVHRKKNREKYSGMCGEAVTKCCILCRRFHHTNSILECEQPARTESNNINNNNIPSPSNLLYHSTMAAENSAISSATLDKTPFSTISNKNPTPRKCTNNSHTSLLDRYTNRKTFAAFYKMSSLFNFCILINLLLIMPETVTGQYNSMHLSNNTITATKSGVCTSRDIRNTPGDLSKLNGCRVVEGFVQITLIDIRNGSTDGYVNQTFPLLIEITDYLLLFRVQGLQSLQSIFPNLQVIRGNKLFKNYALVIYELADIQDIGLSSLTYIGRGGVRIEKNPSLCYAKSVDWTLIAPHTASDPTIHYILLNKQENVCPVCPGNHTLDGKDNPNSLSCFVKRVEKRLCWNKEYCQKVCSSACIDKDVACDIKSNECCDQSCIGGCYRNSTSNTSHCTVCRHFTIEDENGILPNQCVDKCPPNYFEHMGRRCVTNDECRSIHAPLGHSTNQNDRPYIPFNGKCALKCPDNYEVVEINKKNECRLCTGPCRVNCNAAIIDSIANAQHLRACTHITGSLEIQIRSQGGFNIVKELEQSLSSIVEIQGHLKVVRSFPLLSFNFLKNLKVIRGEPLESEKYALIVMDNQNLQDLWEANHTLQIMKGKLYFHFNPKLCFGKIENLKKMTKDKFDFVDEDVARSSNGDKIACNVTTLEVKVIKNTYFAVMIQWPKLKFDDQRSLLGYIVYYTVAPYKNVTLYDGRDACGGDGWHVDDVSDSDLISDDENDAPQVTHLITHVEPYTQYAFYVKTYTLSSVSMGAISKIEYFRSAPGEPGIVQKLRGISNDSSIIVLSWEAPKKANGNLTTYIIKAKIHDDNLKLLLERDYCNEPVQKTENLQTETLLPETKKNDQKCDCLNPFDPSNNGGQGMGGSTTRLSEAEAELSIDFEDSLHNYIYVKRGSSNRRKRDVDNSDDEELEFPLNTNLNQSSGDTDEKKNIKNKSGAYMYFYRKVYANTTTFLIPELKHFTSYQISVRACREKVDEDETDKVPYCSKEVIIHQMTKKIDYADNITVFSAKRSTNNASSGDALITWERPEAPNGVILTYTIRYQRVDIENAKFDVVCLPHKLFENFTNSLHYILSNLHTGNYSVQLQATSLAGDGKWTEKKFFDIESQISVGVIVMIASIVIVFILLMVLILLYCRRRYMPVNNLKLIASVNPDYFSMQYTPDSWEVLRDDIKKIRELGQGSFGMVYEGSVRNLQKTGEDMPCAIKTVNENATDRERINFLKEASVMKAFDTNHVVRLLGVVSRGQPTLVIMELMANGDLKGYLRSHRPDTESLKAGQPPPQPPTLKRILQMAIEIADGMSYLSAKKFVHRDLAARNCMVAEELTVKIGDFGMTRDIYETDYYRKGTKGLLPVRWMAPESLKDGVFTSHSDVFSYGVVLWEMATLASQPYQGLSNDQVLRYVIDGGVMERPENCPDILYDLMRRCWQHRPSARPSFVELVSILLDDANTNFRNVSFYHTSEGQEIVNQMHAAPQMDDVTTPLRHEDAMSLDVDADDVDNYSYDRNDSPLVEGDGPLPTIRSAHSPLSGGMGSGLFSDHNYVITSYQSGHSQLKEALNSVNSKLTLSTSEQSDRIMTGGGGLNKLRNVAAPPQHYNDDHEDWIESSGGGVSGFILRNALCGSGSGSNIVGSGLGIGKICNNTSDYKKLNSNSINTTPPLGNGYVKQQQQQLSPHRSKHQQ